MDSLTEDSPLYRVVLVADYIERLTRSWPSLPVLLPLLLVFFTSFGGSVDILLNLTLVLWFNRDAILFIARPGHPLTAAVIALVAINLAARLLQNRKHFTWKGLGRPLLIPSRTTHTRIFPQRHSFSYSYLLAGVPVGASGDVNGILSLDLPKDGSSWTFWPWTGKAWFEVSCDDYLQRGHDSRGLRGKLDCYLTSQGVVPSDYPHAYLVTAARFLGYHFNPVSFWYLYSSDKVLSAIVLEVNNTFGERRPYLVKRDFDAESKQLAAPDSGVSDGTEEPARLRASWTKDFHVSPFNSRKGTYSLLASDPLWPNMEGFRGINVTINLASSKNHPKLVARLFSEGNSVDPMALGGLGRLGFLLRWSWVGFVTFPRIVKEAATLFFKRKLHVWYRPEPLKQSFGRDATASERTLEGVFRAYLRHLVRASTKPIVVRYIPSGVTNHAEDVFRSELAQDESDNVEHIEFKVLTPVFYTRFVHYAHDFEAIFNELSESQTISVDQPELLPKIFFKKGSPPVHATSVIEFLAFKCMQHLRRRPERIQRPMTSAEAPPPATTAPDIRDFRISSMDAFALEEADNQMKRAYRSTVIRLFLADWLCLGSVELLQLVEFGAHLGIAFTTASLLNLAGWEAFRRG